MKVTFIANESDTMDKIANQLKKICEAQKVEFTDIRDNKITEEFTLKVEYKNWKQDLLKRAFFSFFEKMF